MQRLYLGRSLLHAGRVGNVAGQGTDFACTVFPQGGRQFAAFVQVAVKQHHVGLLLHQGCGQRCANAAGRAGHHAYGRLQA
ncbi:hypothetical protein D3C72_2166160 [compost metagenome]